MRAVLQLNTQNTHVTLRRTAVVLIGEFAEWIERNSAEFLGMFYWLFEFVFMFYLFQIHVLHGY
jgi:hypothetical protein